MPRVPLTPENKKDNPFDYPRLQLDYGARARLLMIEKDPVAEYVHSLSAPQIMDGKVVMTQRRQKSGDVVEEPKMDFIGRHICLGRIEAVADKGVDPEQCPMCKAATESDAIEPPKRRFALHVISYRIRAGGWEVQEPFSVELLAWAFSDQVFNKLVDLEEEWKPTGGLKQHDVKLGPCENKQYQKFDIQAAGDAAWLADSKVGPNGKIDSLGPRAELVTRTFKENQHDDLTVFIGRKSTAEKVREDIERVTTRYRQAFKTRGPVEMAPETPEEVAAQVDLSGLLDGAGEAESPAEEQGASEDTGEAKDVDFDSLLADLPE
jgi:hypothetical protein